jgi:uncharacterized protein YbjT (DUF2867 family)
MNVILFGGSGMVGQGVLRECLLASDVERVLNVGRSPSGQKHEKLREILHTDFTDLSAIEGDLAGLDACFFCLGVSSAGLSEAEYTRLTYDFTLGPARVLARRNPSMSFIYVSGAGTDSTERGRSMWARVKGKTENALFALPFKAAYMFRPGGIQPLYGAVSKTTSYRIIYTVMGPLLPVLRAIAPSSITTTELVGRAMLNVARHGAPKKILETRDINQLGALRGSP